MATFAYGCPKNALCEEIDERTMLVAAGGSAFRGVPKLNFSSYKVLGMSRGAQPADLAEQLN
jgi:hypothetical protein